MKKSLFSLILVSLILAVYSQKSSCNSSLTTVPSINKFNELPTSTNTQTKERIQLSQSQVEVVASNTATGDGGNAWGGHQTRIVNTKDGVFTAYTTGDEYFNRNWQLAHREEDGKWKIIATGIAGREPVNLLASPDGTLHIIGWPNGIGTMWSGKPHEGQITMKKEAISGVSYGDYPFNSAGIDSRGNICVLSSSGGEIPGGLFRWACFLPASKNWIFHSTLLDYRFCYTYVFPNSDGSLSLISTRDVRWSALKYEKPDFINYDYVYNAFGYWYTDNLSKGTLNRVYQIEEKPTEIFNYPELNATLDAYLDSNNEMHVIYRIKGASTNGVTLLREAVLAKDGTLIKDIQLPEDIGMNPRIFQDTKGNFFILGSSGKLYPAGRDGVTLTDPYQLNLGGYNVEWSGFGISVPRTGSMVSDTIHVVYPSGNGTKWIYFEFNLPEQ